MAVKVEMNRLEALLEPADLQAVPEHPPQGQPGRLRLR